MIRKFPLIPTILVGLAIAVMIGLGIWQLERREQKLALLENYEAAAGLPPIGWPSLPPKEPLPLFRYATGNCLQVTGFRTAAGQNLKGEPGFLVIADCRTGAEGPGMAVELGWSKNRMRAKPGREDWSAARSHLTAKTGCDWSQQALDRN